ncbi:RNA polymerase subunit RPABC4/transcription elongation factor Spt4/predicted transcriptional regulator [Halorubrum trapanicum]|uniref:RNA polymerase subunit RPABC4/transcription elongation factor Spt4/predicted transcriptional regulator n=1 Tax=Halorubrum trapanicum TaxID=29284 RepID=A0A8J7RW44_9EURY|nr:zinc ribbon domain-containing protein [Halorubrum trapanicum]MBP1902692.1 RNA polymerase subunit RPABC4/transcription elongation factor Spt4/predicted transcriptional regulator [Halorubrum trapanicum]
MSKITFRADDDLVDRLEACDASKSEVMREALRTHLDGGDEAASDESDAATGSVDDALADRVDELIAERLDAALDERLGPTAGAATPAYTAGSSRDINVNVTLDAPNAQSDESEGDVRVTRETATDGDPGARKTDADPSAQTRESACGGCGEIVPSDHVYCPNCGEKQSHRAFCECGDELRTDWAFCPGCGRRTPAADVLKDDNRR